MIKQEYDGCYNLVNNPEGWTPHNVTFDLHPDSMFSIHHLDDPKYAKLINHPSTTPENLRETLRRAHEATEAKRFAGGPDFDGLKASMKRVTRMPNGELYIDARLTCYGVTWGLWGNTELRNIHQQGLLEMRDHKATELPFGICLAPILLTRDRLVVSVVRAFSQGFHAGRVSLSFEEQMDPEKDLNPFATTHRGSHEEFGVIPTYMRLLGIEAEKSSAYTLWGVIGYTDRTGAQVVDAWEHAKDRNEATALFLIPTNEAGAFAQPEIPGNVCNDYLKGGELPARIQENPLGPHPSNAWRADLLKDYLAAI